MNFHDRDTARAVPACSIADCGRSTVARGLCPAHYQRWRKHGDPLAGGTAMGAAAAYFRDVVIPYAGDDCLAWPFAVNTGGYGQLAFGGKIELVSRLVCSEVYGPAPTSSHEAAHSCGRGHLACVAKKHLRWDTRVGNFSDKERHGTLKRGEGHVHAKLTEVQVRRIRELSKKLSHTALAQMFGTSRPNVTKICLRQRWGWLP